VKEKYLQVQVYMYWCHQYHEVQMNMKYVPEHVKTWYILQIHWLIIFLIMMKASTKKQQVTAWSGMSCSLQTRRLELYCWPAGLWKDCILFDLQPKMWTLGTAFFADMMYERSCPFNEKVCVETELSLCATSPPNLIACNVLITFVWPVHYY